MNREELAQMIEYAFGPFAAAVDIGGKIDVRFTETEWREIVAALRESEKLRKKIAEAEQAFAHINMLTPHSEVASLTFRALAALKEGV